MSVFIHLVLSAKKAAAEKAAAAKDEAAAGRIARV